MFVIDSLTEYDEWFNELDDSSKTDIFQKVLLLETFGYNLKRPYADTLKGSKYPNLKELRIQSENHIIRISYIFDKKRKGMLLIGGDKKGKNEKDFYKDLIQKSEFLIEKYNLK